MKRRCVFWVGFLVALPALPALGDPLPPLRVLLRGCDDLGETEVERILAVELGAEQPAKFTEPTFIVARCAGGRVIIEVSDPVSRKMLRRTFDLGTAPAAGRARLIGIAASELVLASWAELALRPVLRVEPEGRAPSSATAAIAVQRVRTTPIPQRREEPRNLDWPPGPIVASERRPHERSLRQEEQFRLVVLASTRAFLDHDGALFGGGVRLGDQVFSATSWALDALFESGSLETSAGNLQVETWTVGGMIYFYAGSGAVTARGGAGLRAGMVTTSLPPGEASLSRVITPWGWPMLALSATVQLGSTLVLELSGESSYVALPVLSGGLGDSVDGLWFSAQLGVGAAP